MKEQALMQRIEQLEATVCYQDDTLEAMNKTLGQQHQEIQKLQQQMAMMSELMKNLRLHNNSYIKHPNEESPPPHY